MAELVAPPGYEFLQRAFTEAKTITLTNPVVQGPYAALCKENIVRDDAAVKAIDPRLSFANLWQSRYQPAEAQHVEKALKKEKGPAISYTLHKLREQRSHELDAVATQLQPQLAAQYITAQALDSTPYYRQGGDRYDGNSMSCSLAAYRMVFGAIAGQAPPELGMASYLRGAYREVAIEDSTYLKLLHTPAFHDLSGKKILGCCMLFGADLAQVNRQALKFKAKDPARQVYAVASLASFDKIDGITDNILHKVVLCEANETGVICNDPAYIKGGGERTLIKHAEFTRRWIAAHNMVQLVVAR